MTITVIIPVKNGSHTLERCLSSIRKQTIGSFLEIIVLDSMSTDSSREIAKKYNAVIIDIPTDTFNHGSTRNIGVKAATSDNVFFTVQDAYFADENMLDKMLVHFKDENIRAITGHQAVPHDKNKNPAFWFKRFTKPVIEVKYFANPMDIEKLKPAQKVAKLHWDNVVALYRKKALLEIPFIKTDFAEDAFWCYKALLRGWTLLYDPSIVVFHYHHKTYNYSYQVSWAVNFHFFIFFKYKPKIPPFFSLMARRIYHLVRHDELSFTEKLYWIKYNLIAELGNLIAVFEFLWQLNRRGQHGITNSYFKRCKKIPQGKQNF